MSRVQVLLAVGLVAVASLPSVAAHSVEQPLPVETHLLQDEGRDEFYWYDGYDLWTLFVREAHVIGNGSSGLVFRFTLYGGFGPVNASDALHVDIRLETPDGPRTLRLTTQDDETWTGDALILDKNVTEGEPPWTGVTTELQAFVTYDRLDVSPGDTLSGFRMASFADDDIRDVAPGGIFVPNSQGMLRIPSDNSSVGEAAYMASQRVADEMTLTGPVGYLDRSVRVDGWNLTIDVANPFQEQGQHVIVQSRPTPGWEASVQGRAAKVLEPGGNATFEMTARPTPEASEPLGIVLRTDVGGREVLYLGAEEGRIVPAEGPDATVDAPEPAPASTPGPGLVVALLAVAVGAWWRRSNRRSGA